ncbi:MAG: hypothetical protein WBN40_09840 [Pseudomonadales bacterium]
MSLIAQMQRDRQQGEPHASNSELPLFAAAEAIAASKRKRGSLLALAPAILVPVLIIAGPVLVGNHFKAQLGVQVPDTAVVANDIVANDIGANDIVANDIAAHATVANVKDIAPHNALQSVAASNSPASVDDATSISIPDRQAGSKVAEPEGDVQLASTINTAVSKAIENPKTLRPIQVAPTKEQRIEVQAKLAAVSPAPEKNAAREANHGTTEVIDFKRVAPVSALQRDRILLGKASELVEHGAAEMARQMLQSEIGQSMEFPDSAALLASLLVEHRAFDRAGEILASYINTHPGHNTLQITQLRLQLSQGSFDQVLQGVNAMSPGLRDRVDVIELQAAALQSIGDYSAASYYYRQLLRRDDTNARWWMSLAVALDADAQTQEARRAYTIALEHRGLGVALARYARQRLAQL